MSSTEIDAPRAVGKPSCIDRPEDWDLDVGSPIVWREAVRTCHACPLLTQCAELAQVLISRGATPRAQIWAGIAYDKAGNVIADLDRRRLRVSAPPAARIIVHRPGPVTVNAIRSLTRSAPTPAAEPTVEERPLRRITIRRHSVER
jgi:hypothetical protein